MTTPAGRAVAVMIGGIGLLVAAACGEASLEPGETALEQAGETEAAWRPLPPAPLSAREQSLAVTVDGRILVIGGSDFPPCPPNASCIAPDRPPFSDGASYDPATGEWTRIADAPVPIGGIGGSNTAVIGTTVYITTSHYPPGGGDVDTSFVSYDVDADRWDTLTTPGLSLDRAGLVAVGEHIVAYAASHERSGDIAPLDPLPADLMYAAASESWHELPADPLGPSFDRSMVSSDEGLVLLAHDLVPSPGTEPPSTRAAVLDLGNDPVASTWTELPAGEVISANGYFDVAGVLVNAQEGGADGGQVDNWGRFYPNGAILDPAVPAWSELPERPEREVGDGYPVPVDVAGSRTVVSGGWALDVPTGSWTRVPSDMKGADDDAVLPTTGQAVAWADTGAGGILLMWGGAYWPDGNTSEGGRLLNNAWVWAVDSP